MAFFKYVGIDHTGKKVKSNVSADTIAIAKNKIKSLNIMLIEIKEQKANFEKSKSYDFSLFQRVSSEDLSLFTRQFATLLKAKIQVVEALTALIQQTENPKLKTVISDVKQQVNEGSSIANALSRHPQVFNNIYFNMVEAGETSGKLDLVLLRLADFTENQVKLQRKIKGAMTYPLIMMSVGTIMISIIFIFVIPKITKIFISMKKELPLQTKISIGISNFLIDYWWLVIILGILSWQGLKKYIQTKKGRSLWDSIILKLPIVGTIITMINVNRFCSTLSTLLGSGVSILVSINIVKNLISNIHMQQSVEKSHNFIKEGLSMTPPLVESKLFPPLVTHMISLGEKSGELEPMLQIIAKNYEEQVDAKLSGLTSILEPIMMVCMGIIVAFVVFSVIVPIMELNSIG